MEASELDQRSPGGAALIAGCVLLQILTTVVFIARLISRAGILRTWKSDDYLLLTGWIFTFVLTVLSALGPQYGVGRDISTLTASERYVMTEANYVGSILYVAALFFSKLSVCLLYLRTFPDDRFGRWAIFGCITFLIMYYVPVELVTIFPCWPTARAWDFAHPWPAARCVDARLLLYSAVFSNVFSDLWIICVAVPRIAWMRRLPRRQKRALLGLVGLGWVLVAASLIRMFLIADLLNGVVEAHSSWKLAGVLFWTAFEVDLWIIVASALAARPLLAVMFPRCALFRPAEPAGGDPWEVDAEQAGQQKAGVSSAGRALESATSFYSSTGEHSRKASEAGSEAFWEAEANGSGRKRGLDWFIVKTNSVLVTTAPK